MNLPLKRLQFLGPVVNHDEPGWVNYYTIAACLWTGGLSIALEAKVDYDELDNKFYGISNLVSDEGSIEEIARIIKMRLSNSGDMLGDFEWKEIIVPDDCLVSINLIPTKVSNMNNNKNIASIEFFRDALRARLVVT